MASVTSTEVADQSEQEATQTSFANQPPVMPTDFSWLYHLRASEKHIRWAAVLTTEERDAIVNLQHFNFHRKRLSPDFSERIKPFFYRMAFCGITLVLVGMLPLADGSVFSILCGALGFYLFAVLLVIAGSIFAFAPQRRG